MTWEAAAACTVTPTALDRPFPPSVGRRDVERPLPLTLACPFAPIALCTVALALGWRWRLPSFVLDPSVVTIPAALALSAPSARTGGMASRHQS